MKTLILHNIASSYYKNILFSALYKKYNDFKVIHFAETQDIRQWKMRYEELNYPYEILHKGSINKVSELKISLEVINKLNVENPRIIYIGGYYHLAFWAALFWAKSKMKKVIIEMGSNKWAIRKRSFLKEAVKKIFIRLCDTGIVYSDLSKEYLIELGMNRYNIYKKPNIIDNTLFNYQEDIEKPKEFIYPHNFLYVGRLAPEKNLIFIIERFWIACRKANVDSWGLVLVGDGPLKEEVENFIKQKGITNVLLAPFKHREELLSYYCNGDILILPSIQETWGIVVNEAMASSLPVIMSNRCGSAYELVKDGENGFIIDPLDKEKVIKLFADIMCGKYDLKAMGTRSREIIECFTPEMAADGIIKAIASLKQNFY